MRGRNASGNLWAPAARQRSATCVAELGRVQWPDHDVVAFGVSAQPEAPRSVDGETAPLVKLLSAFVFLIDTKPYTAGAPFGGSRERGVHQCRRRARAVVCRQHVH